MWGGYGNIHLNKFTFLYLLSSISDEYIESVTSSTNEISVISTEEIRNDNEQVCLSTESDHQKSWPFYNLFFSFIFVTICFGKLKG